MTSACFSRGHTGFSRNATLVATVNPPALAGGVFNSDLKKNDTYILMIATMMAVSSIGMFVLLSEVIF